MAYPNDCTPAEARAGFSRITAKTGKGSPQGERDEVSLVVKPLGGERRAVKGESGYFIQILSVADRADDLEAWIQEGEDHVIYTLDEIAAM